MNVTLYDWFYSNYPPTRMVVNGRFGIVHIGVALLCVTLILLAASQRTKSYERRMAIIRTLAFCILLFEVTRRVINFSRGDTLTPNYTMYLLLPRPWCAISCWLIIASTLIQKKALYNISAACSMLCALVFFAYPMVGFDHEVYLFEDVYSIATHALLLVTSVSMMTLGVTDYRYKRADGGSARNEFEILAWVIVYAFFEIYVLKIERDPLYFLPGNDVQSVFGLSYPLYLVVYISFLVLYFNAFYLIPLALRHKKQKALPLAA